MLAPLTQQEGRCWVRVLEGAEFKLSIGRVRGEISWSVGGQQGSIHGLHAGGTGEGPHQPVVYTVHVVDVHTWQKPNGVSINKVQHTDHASKDKQTNKHSKCPFIRQMQKS